MSGFPRYKDYHGGHRATAWDSHEAYTERVKPRREPTRADTAKEQARWWESESQVTQKRGLVIAAWSGLIAGWLVGRWTARR